MPELTETETNELLANEAEDTLAITYEV